MKSKVLKVIIISEDNENIADGEMVFFDCNIFQGQFHRNYEDGKAYGLIEYVPFFSEIKIVKQPDEKGWEEATVIDTKDINSRPITMKEFEMLKDFHLQEHKRVIKKYPKLKDKFEYDEDINSFLAFDVSENYTRIAQTIMSLSETKGGKKSIENITIFYSIKFGIVNEEDSFESNDDYEIDISEINDLL